MYFFFIFFIFFKKITKRKEGKFFPRFVFLGVLVCGFVCARLRLVMARRVCVFARARLLMEYNITCTHARLHNTHTHTNTLTQSKVTYRRDTLTQGVNQHTHTHTRQLTGPVRTSPF